ncbi:protein LATERAL ROOT PRIMORDIUM 1-like [Curcuma longa]|uniref:protein LATERAL ROOT PRIMORDIUM 1-like n=1 Tax=Curcuma longa TaxID=136217 RepID=UPI003D9ED7B5
MPADMGTVVFASAASLQHHHESLLSGADHHPAIIPLLAATPCVVDDDSPAVRGKLGGGIHIWQPAQPQAALYHHDGHPLPAHNETNPNPNPNPNPTLYNYLRKPIPMLESSVIIGATAGVGASTCQDCGNQAKKDCSHRRCRTCCKSRGFECSTHVKSTWVPAARRRERQIGTSAAASTSTSTSATKKPRLVSSQPTTASHTSTSNTTRSFDTTSSHQDASVKENLPGHVRAPALFKCVRVTSIDDGEDEYAYHAMVKIGGRVFKGFLYDHGLDDGGGHSDDGKESSIPNISELHLGNRFGGASSSTMQSPSDAFGGGLVGSTHYDNQING